ncbi:TPA: hypothetical protein EYP45_03385 [Candidatus Peregrinibacteria bacterium]|nr:hypothetical protein [Candidatus Peregrinibacteria bacterium]
MNDLSLDEKWKKVDFYISDILKEFLLLGKNKDLHQSLSIRSDIALLFVFIEVLSSFWKVYVWAGMMLEKMLRTESENISRLYLHI